MQTKLLIKLLEETIETNRIGKYSAGFRYTPDHHGAESLAVDLYKGGENFMHRICYTNDDLKSCITAFEKAKNSNSRWGAYIAGKQ